MSFTWIPFYSEFAEKLLDFRHDRKSLLNLIYSHREELCANYLHDEDGVDDLCTDIDPFTTFGLFNRGTSHSKRLHTIETLRNLLKVSANVPKDFEGIPVLNNQMSHFFGFRSRRKRDDIENLWRLFEKVIKGESFEDEFNVVKQQFIININITMALFWIRPKDFLSLDSTNREYLQSHYKIDLPTKVPTYSDYMALLRDIKGKMASGKIKEKNFYELSSNAYSSNPDEDDDYYASVVHTLSWRKNIVLYGAPGTGKTYDVPEIVVRLCDPNFNSSDCSRESLMQRYSQLKQEKRIAFTTFHQSMDYEDWMEGLKPIVNEDNHQVTYDVVDGIFKKLCQDAEHPTVKDKHVGIADDAVVWKVSLCGTGDNPVRKECMEKGHIRIGWDDYGSVISDETDWSIYNGEGRRVLDAFINGMKKGDIVMSCYSSTTVDAIGVVTGDYEFDDVYRSYKRVRKVNWILKGINENIIDMNDGKAMTLATVYRLNAITLDNVRSILDKYKKPEVMEANVKPYVMVIDELNRGNVSRIFGELITLLEPDKRKGRENAESVMLPYSKKPFMVPDNVFIIATMNTADRSLGTLDYAIRRRFAFIACKPYSLDGGVDGFDEELFKMVSSLFIKNYDDYKDSDWNQGFSLEPAETLSEEYRPEDVWIGQSYFIMKDESGHDVTSDRLLYEVIPLLQEYVRDGVLTDEAQKTIDSLHQRATES